MLALTGIHKSFGTNVVLNNLSLSIREGEFYSLLGPNGAGKSTTINIISQLLKPDQGKVVIGGHDASQNMIAVKKLIGVVPQEIALYEEFTAWENLQFWGRLNGVSKTEINQKGKHILERFGLFDRKDERIKTYSGGMKRRINIAVALLHDPSLILMDEPTVGIDPQSRNNIYEFIEELRKQGKTILYTTHYMEEAERFSDRIGIIDNGQIIINGTFTEIQKSVNLPDSIVVSYEGDLGTTHAKFVQMKEGVRIENNSIYLSTTDFKNDLKTIVSLFNDCEADIVHFERKETDLETIFLKLTGKTLRD